MAVTTSPTSVISLPSRISARAIIAGVVVALAIDVFMMAFGAAIGLSAFKATPGVPRGVAIWGVIWFFITVLTGGFFGGWVAAASSGLTRQRDGILHGFVTWAAATVLATMMFFGAIAGAGQMAAQAAPALTGGEQTQGAPATPSVTPRNEQAAANYAGLGAWALFLGLGLACGGSIIGGAVGAGLEKRVEVPVGVVTTTPPTVPPVPVA